MAVPVLVITGPIGAGKTVVVSEVGDQLEAAGVPSATCEFDELTQAWPRPPDDPFQVELGVRNLACVWSNFAAAGATRLVLGMTVEAEAERRAVSRAIPAAEVFMVRLTAAPAELRRRVAGRELGSGRDWHLERALELAEIMERSGLEDAVVATDGRPVPEIAREVLVAAGWLY